MASKEIPFFFVGSLPFLSVQEAIEFVATHSAHLPFLPQLPELNPQEDMIGQVIRGLHLGAWDETASCALPNFIKRFAKSPQVKFQMAGPLTSARALSVPLEEMFRMHLQLVKQLLAQWRDAGIEGDIWFQLDEPFWSMEKELPSGYENYLTQLKDRNAGTLKLGFHSCASHRPTLSGSLLKITDFFHFDYTKIPPSEEEKKQMASDSVWALGIKDRDSKNEEVTLPRNGKFFLSSPCGLADWTTEDIARTFLY